MRHLFSSAMIALILGNPYWAHAQGEVTLPNDYVFALTGYHPDFEFLRGLGIKLSGEADKRPVVDPKTLESNVPGIYLAGVIIAGMRTSEIFIENGRFHGQLIAADLKRKMKPEMVAAV